MPSQRSWQAVAEAKQEEQLSRIPTEWRLSPKQIPGPEVIDLRPIAATCGILSEREINITSNYDATALVEKMAAAEFTAEEVAIAFCKRAAIGQQLCKNLTEIMFADAIEAAKRLDVEFKKTGKIVGPLHGVPMTFKECFHVKGYDYTDGYISRAFNPSMYDSYLIELVRQAGAVVIAKTNNPQTMLVAESHNNVFGQTKNPVVSHLTPGGSSGGEGSVQAFRSSALGIGTDVGGSIRMPAAVNGIYAYKPSAYLLPLFKYAWSNWPGSNTGVPAVCGPMGHSVRDMTLLTKTVRAARPWLHDPSMMPYVLEQKTVARKPVVGIIHKSGLTPHPPVRRSMVEAADKLRAAGLEVRDFEPPSFSELRDITKELFTADGLSYAKGELQKAGEPVVPSVLNIGFWDLKAKEPEEIWSWNAKRIEWATDMLNRWREAGLDLVLCPAGPTSAVKPDEYKNEMYTVVWNAVDYPVVILPFTTVDPKVDLPDTEFTPLSDLDNEYHESYDPQLLAGAPVSLQLVAPKLDDAQLLRDAELIDSILNPQHA